MKGINKDDLFSFMQGQLEPINFDLVQYNDLNLQRTMIRESITTESTTCQYAYH
jgi:hypothetical protein